MPVREIEERDLKLINQWRNDPGTLALLGSNFLYISQGVDRAWYENYLATRETAVRLAIVGPRSDRIVGCVNLTNIHCTNRSAEFSIIIGNPKYRGRGYGKGAAGIILKHAFGDLNLNRVHLRVLSHNKTALQLYLGLGFVKEGTLRESVFKQGVYVDEIVMAMLRSDYERTLGSPRRTK